MHRTMRPALSNLIPFSGRLPGIVMVAPVFNVNEQFIGSLSIVFQPYELSTQSLRSQFKESTRSTRYKAMAH